MTLARHARHDPRGARSRSRSCCSATSIRCSPRDRTCWIAPRRPGAHGVLVTDLPVGADPMREAWLGSEPARLRPARRADDAARAHARDRGARQRIRLSDQPARRDGPSDTTCRPSCRQRSRACARRRRSRCASASASRRAEQAKAVGQLADGIVVGSAIVQAADASVDAAVDLVGTLRRALDDRSDMRRASSTSPDAIARAGPVNRFLTLYARLVASLGTVLLVVALVARPAMDVATARPRGRSFAISLLLRTFQIPLTKYSALNLLGMVAAGGAVITGAPTTALGLYLGVLLADWLLLRKAPVASAINAGREALALFAAFGFYAWFARRSATPATSGRITTEIDPGGRAVARRALPVQPRAAVLHAAHSRQAVRRRAVADPALRGHCVRRRHHRGTRLARHDLQRRLDGVDGRGVRARVRRPVAQAHSRGGRRRGGAEQDPRDGAGRLVRREPRGVAAIRSSDSRIDSSTGTASASGD